MDRYARVFRLRAFHRACRARRGRGRGGCLAPARGSDAGRRGPDPEGHDHRRRGDRRNRRRRQRELHDPGLSPPRRLLCAPSQLGDGTGLGLRPADFTASSGTVSLTKTTTSRVVTVPVTGDASDEPNETFVVNLSNLTGSPGSILDAQGVATITDDDAPPTALGERRLGHRRERRHRARRRSPLPCRSRVRTPSLSTGPPPRVPPPRASTTWPRAETARSRPAPRPPRSASP